MPLSVAMPEPITEVLQGVSIVDPYRWLEDRNSARTEEWIAHQQRQHHAYFENCEDLDLLRARVRQFLDVEVIDQPVHIGQQYFYRRKAVGQEHGCICVRDELTDQERVLADPSSRGRFTSIGIYCISADGSLLAYEVKQGGSDERVIQIADTRTATTLPDMLDCGYVRGFAFAPDKSGFCYCRESGLDDPERTIRFHRFGKPMSDDQVIFGTTGTQQNRLNFWADETHLAALITHISGSDRLGDFYLRTWSGLQWKAVFRDKPFPFWPILERGRIFVCEAVGEGADRVVELANTGAVSREIIPGSNSRIRQLCIAGGAIYASQLPDRQVVLRSWTLAGECQGPIELPPSGTIRLLPQLSSGAETIFFTHESFHTPLTTFELFPGERQGRVWAKRGGPAESEACDSQEVWYSSKDGTRIPMFIAERRTAERRTLGPAIMTGYGGFGVSVTPQFSVLVWIMLELGAVFALPNIRGGGEFGHSWHEAGRGRNRQVAFDDFIAAAEWLHESGRISPRKLAIFGGSNSGLLVGAVMTQRPELFRAVLCIAPLLDMLRYEHFDRAYRWEHEFGTIRSTDDFQALLSYSPYHNVMEERDYPATLFVSGDKDDRCNPAHVRKMAARLQERDAQKSPVIVDYSDQRGHSPVLPLSVRVDALARRIAFLCKELNIRPHKEFTHETAVA